MSNIIKSAIKNEDTVQEIMGYGSMIGEIQNAAEQLHSVWNEESGDKMFDRVGLLVEEMKDNYEGLVRWIGSGL